MATTEKSVTKLVETVRQNYVGKVTQFLKDSGEEIIATASNEFTFPVIDEAGNERWVIILVKVPKGSRDGEEYDGYAAGKEYTDKQAEKVEKAAALAAKKAKDIAKREAAKAEKEAAKKAAQEKGE